MKLNRSRIWLGGIVGGLVWNCWSFFIGMRMNPFYMAMQNAGIFLKQPRYPLFPLQWIILIFVAGILLAHLYAWSRSTIGPGPRSALKVGMTVGFIAGVPLNFATASWATMPRMLPLGWMLDMWIGSILATLAAGWLYKEKA